MSYQTEIEQMVEKILSQDTRIGELESALTALVNFCLEHPAVYDGATPIKNAIKLLEGN